MKKPIAMLLVFAFCLSCGVAQAFTYGETIFQKNYDYQVKQWHINAAGPSKTFSLDMGYVFDSADVKGITDLGFVEFSFFSSVQLDSQWRINFEGGELHALPASAGSSPLGYEYKLVLTQASNGAYLDYLWSQYPLWLQDNDMLGLNNFSLFFINEGPANDFTINYMKVGFYAPTPIPGAVWLLGSGLVSLAAFRARNRFSGSIRRS